MIKELISKEDIIWHIENKEGFTYKQANYIRYDSNKFGVKHINQQIPTIYHIWRKVCQIEERFFMEDWTYNHRTFFKEVKLHKEEIYY